MLLLAFLLAACAQPLDREPVPSPDAPQPAVKTLLSSLLAGPTANTPPTITTEPQATTSNSTPAPGPTATAADEAGGDQGTPREVIGPVDEMSLPYYVQSGDTLPVVTARFGVRMDEITSPDPLPISGLLRPGQLLVLPSNADFTLPFQLLMPDSEVVYGPSALDFDASAYLQAAGGYLSQNPEYLRSTGWTDPGVIVERVALENSINPRFLISLLEYSCSCVLAEGGDQLEGGIFAAPRYVGKPAFECQIFRETAAGDKFRPLQLSIAVCIHFGKDHLSLIRDDAVRDVFFSGDDPVSVGIRRSEDALPGLARHVPSVVNKLFRGQLSVVVGVNECKDPAVLLQLLGLDAMFTFGSKHGEDLKRGLLSESAF